MLERYRVEHGDLPCSINTFGFGYDIDSPLLSAIANEGNGTYAFIPDTGLVGTVFVNTMSNLLTTISRRIQVTLRPRGGCSILDIKGGYSRKTIRDEQNGSVSVNLGALQCGQTRDLVLRMAVDQNNENSFLEAAVECVGLEGRKLGASHSAHLVASSKSDAAERQLIRSTLVDKLDGHLNSGHSLARFQVDRQSALRDFQQFATEIRNSTASEDLHTKALLEDIEGQISEALSREDWLCKWGTHYLPSLMAAHRIQQCNNFKDPGVQMYGGKLFHSIQDAADDIFNRLPTPKPSLALRSNGFIFQGPASMYNNPYVQQTTTPVSMSVYNNPYGG